MKENDLVSISSLGYWNNSSSGEYYVDTFGWQFFGSRINIPGYYSTITLSQTLKSNMGNLIKLSSGLTDKIILQSKTSENIVLDSRQI